MKKSICVFIAGLFCSLAGFSLSGVKVYHLDNNIPVYISSDPSAKVCSVAVAVKGGIENLTYDKSGLESALFTMMTMGSKMYSYEDIQRFTYRTRGGFQSTSGIYGSVYKMNCLSKYFDETFDRFVEGFLNPAYGAKEYDNLIQSYNQSVQQTLNDPDNILFFYAGEMIYDGHPYYVSSGVKPYSIENITVEAMKKHHRTVLDSRKISIVAGGLVDEEKLLSELNKKFGRIGVGNSEISEKIIPPLKIEGKPVVLSHPDAKNSGYIMRAFPAPSVRSEDFAATRLITDIYSVILYNVVRENYGVCYTPECFSGSSDAPFAAEYLYRVSDLKGFKAAVEEARSIMQEGKTILKRDEKGNYVFEDLSESLESYKNKYINRKYAGQSTVSAVVGRMCAGILQFDDIYASDMITEKVKAVTCEDILVVFDKYWCQQQGQWFAVVAPDEEELLKF